MIVTITLNPAIDKHIMVEELYYDKTNIVKDKRVVYGGKGINVSSYLSVLKQENIASGFMFSYDEKSFISNISNDYTICDFLSVSGHTRENIKIDHKGKLLEFNDNNVVSCDDQQRFIEHFSKYCQKGNIIVLSGSLPKGVSENLYYTLAKMAKDHGCYVILDSSKQPLKYAYEYADVLKPNKEEFCYLFDLDDDTDLIKYASSLNDKRLIVISLGSEGSLFIKDNVIYKVDPLNVEVSTTVGAGDAMVAALAYGLENKLELLDIVTLASALSSLIITEDYKDNFEFKLETLKKQVQITKI